jgi:SIR2-like domain/TIR domain
MASDSPWVPASARAGPLPDVFISYRRLDAAGTATALRRALADEFGAEHVFMDVADIEPGADWQQVLRDRLARCDVLLAVIGGRWLESTAERSRQRLLDHNEDQVALEIATALARGSRTRVIPVLLDSTEMPGRDWLPRPLERLTQLNATRLRHDRWDDDVAALIGILRDLPAPDDGTEQAVVSSHEVIEQRPAQATVTPRAHLATVAGLIEDHNAVVPFLGSGVNASERAEGWSEGCGSLPDRDELAAYLARMFRHDPEPHDLAQISQYVQLTTGEVDLHRALRRILAGNTTPSPVHRDLAALPAILEGHGCPDPYQLIVTANYDDALEQAFAEANEPFDLAVYVAQGQYKGLFVHVPFDGDPMPVTDANRYTGFPVVGDDEYYHLTRTVILKIYGAVDDAQRAYPWRDNFLITENDYIDYLSNRPIEGLVPFQLLNKLRDSHLLFLGYSLRDWSLRVFLQRVWGDQGLGRRAQSWAIGEYADAVEKAFWNALGVVDQFEVPLATYLAELREQVTARPVAPAP